jgi:hypothetical protein
LIVDFLFFIIHKDDCNSQAIYSNDLTEFVLAGIKFETKSVSQFVLKIAKDLIFRVAPSFNA